MRIALVMMMLAGCGRIGLDPIENRGGDATVDTTPDTTTDGPRVCPDDTVAITSGALVCIEKAERGNETWTDADGICRGLGRRLCTDAEWATGCDQAAGLIDMFADQGGTASEWEWVADLVIPGEAAKRGFEFCSSTSSHEIFNDPYDFRCCVDI